MGETYDGAVTIKVIGDNIERNYSIERFREFQCYGRKNADDVCGKCNLRFECFSTAFNEEIEVPIARFRKKHLRDVTAKTVASVLTSIDFREVRGGYDRNIGRTITSRVKINFADVRER